MFPAPPVLLGSPLFRLVHTSGNLQEPLHFHSCRFKSASPTLLGQDPIYW